ncbi:MAG: tRNA glutamyl-Q(34) synthetase GluQRS [Xanthomonadales bacterium]|nr:tRNA glutamyl-Q(34) synthetase GluQRS [Xanthomonadales bacterium]
MPTVDRQSPPIGRFAPSPTGDLHFGSLVAAVASFLQARHAGGQWLVRIDDIDPPREVPDSATRIIQELRHFGMISDSPVLFQSCRGTAYRAALEWLLERNLAYWCGCSRSDLPPSGIYPGTCSKGLPAGKQPRAVRLRVPDESIGFEDLIQGSIVENLQQTVGDFVIWRADGLPAYQLAAVVDDAFQGVTEVVRGSDLLDSTARQISLQRRLGLPTPCYAHHPVATDAGGRKLGKRLGSDPVGRLSTSQTLLRSLRFLGQPCPDGLALAETWQWALANWRLASVPRMRAIPIADNDRSGGLARMKPDRQTV